MRCKFNTYRGFSLIEIAVVLLVIGLLLGMILKPLGAGFDQSKRRQAQLQLEEIRDALIGFAVVNSRLPCPSTVMGAGQEPALCNESNGYVPSVVLGISGNFNSGGLLLDPWGNPIRYSVSLADFGEAGTQGSADFVVADEMRAVGMQNLKPDLVICSEKVSNSCDTGKVRANSIPAVIYSLGKDAKDDSTQGRRVGDKVYFVSREYSQKSGEEFDDIVIWLSDNVLFTRMIEAGVLP
ncbi:MAG: prepilin-type N-terminal cleavage/methylation domain-containing protein [Gammaproteobacteria bacterium]|nr:prepilin-type N-terminal cleavage/methylation domain-containing protein [Gammaproteobacteria bacterium]